MSCSTLPAGAKWYSINFASVDRRKCRLNRLNRDDASGRLKATDRRETGPSDLAPIGSQHPEVRASESKLGKPQ
jgi:hypothetical protein